STRTRSSRRCVETDTLDRLTTWRYQTGIASANRAGRPQRRDLRLVESEHLAQYLIRVLAERRRGCPHRAGSLGQTDRRADHPDLARARMVHLDEGAARLHLGMLDDLRDAVDGADGNPARQQQQLPLLVASREEDLLQPRDQRVAILSA